jgi:hypothetical protein
VFFPLNVAVVDSSMLTVTTDNERLTYGGFSLGKTIHFGSLEFIVDYFGTLSLSPKGNDSSVHFVRTTRNRSPSLRTILEEFYTTSSGEGSSGFPISWRRSMETPPAPITTTPWPEDAMTSQTMMTVVLQTPGSLLSDDKPLRKGNERGPTLGRPTLSVRQLNDDYG